MLSRRWKTGSRKPERKGDAEEEIPLRIGGRAQRHRKEWAAVPERVHGGSGRSDGVGAAEMCKPG